MKTIHMFLVAFVMGLFSSPASPRSISGRGTDEGKSNKLPGTRI